MILLPRWAWPHLLNKKCPVCVSPTNLECVEGIGLQQKSNLGRKIQNGNAVLTFNYCCPQCKKKTHWIADPDDKSVSARDIAQNILETIDQIMGKKTSLNSNKVSASKISNKEFQSFKKILHKFETHDDFLKYIGISQEQIDKLKKDGRKDGDKSK